MTHSADLPFPKLHIDLDGAPHDPAERDRWVRQRQTLAWMQAWGFAPTDYPIKKRIGELLVFRREAQRLLVLARIARARGLTDKVSANVRRACSNHRVVVRHLRAIRKAIAERAP